ncbi:MAG: response regulator transcription factor [Leptolyngbyaceae cyanobacterium MO_188.B28]|nr:response regulator transcription factor [Leptolyngbyaceae cyanobacterium MO_188.B28]
MPQILIVEDNQRLSAVMKKGLAKHGMASVVAHDGDEALHQVQQEDFDLILLDLGLPGKDGWTVVKELSEQGKRPPILVVSARADVDETIQEGRYDVNGFIPKPFKFSHLIAKVQEQLRNQGLCNTPINPLPA